MTHLAHHFFDAKAEITLHHKIRYEVVYEVIYEHKLWGGLWGELLEGLLGLVWHKLLP